MIPLDPQSLLFMVQGLRILTEFAQELQNNDEPMTAARLGEYRAQWQESDKALEEAIAQAKAEGR